MHPSVCLAMLLAQRTLNRYYSMTGDSEVYRIAMGRFSLVDIGLQLISFSSSSKTEAGVLQATEMESEWVDTAKEITEHQFAWYVAKYGSQNDVEEVPETMVSLSFA